MLSNWLAGNFELYRKQEGKGKVDSSSHWLTVGRNETVGFLHNHRANQYEARTGVWDGPGKGQFCWSKKKTGKKHKGERSSE